MTDNRSALRARATRVVERHAQGSEDLAELLDMLGLADRPDDREPTAGRTPPGRRLLISELTEMITATRRPTAARTGPRANVVRAPETSNGASRPAACR